MMIGSLLKEKVLFICQQNSGRSQLAEALLRMLYGDRYESTVPGWYPPRSIPTPSRSWNNWGWICPAIAPRVSMSSRILNLITWSPSAIRPGKPAHIFRGAKCHSP